jgi:hypothetical protein
MMVLQNVFIPVFKGTSLWKKHIQKTHNVRIIGILYWISPSVWDTFDISDVSGVHFDSVFRWLADVLHGCCRLLIVNKFTLQQQKTSVSLYFTNPTLPSHLFILFLQTCSIYPVFSIRKVNTLRSLTMVRVQCMKSKDRPKLLGY